MRQRTTPDGAREAKTSRERGLLWRVKCASVYLAMWIMLCLLPSFWEERFEMRGMY